MTEVEVNVKVVDIQETVNKLFAKFGSPEDKETALRNLEKIKEAKKKVHM